MDFTNHKAIYLQIVDHVCEKVLMRQWQPEERIPSVRELGVIMEVNPNTVMRAYEYLESCGIIYNKRGIGFFLSEQAPEKAIALQKDIFKTETMPAVFKNMYLLHISIEELEAEYKHFCENYTTP